MTVSIKSRPQTKPSSLQNKELCYFHRIVSRNTFVFVMCQVIVYSLQLLFFDFELFREIKIFRGQNFN